MATAISRIDRALHSFWVRLLLSLLILASLVPHRHDALTDLVFLAIFGLELALRLVVFGAGPRDAEPRSSRRRALTGVSLAIDFVALLTFVPWAGVTGLVEARWLRLVRLLRMLLLIGYWAPLLSDSWLVLRRHDRLRQVSLLGLVVALLAFAGAALLSHIPVSGTDFDGDARVDAADAHFWPRLWWAFRQVQDAGNLVDQPGEIAVVIVSLLLTLAGLFVISFLIGLASDVVRELVMLARNRPIGWKDHTVVVHATPGLPLLLGELMAYYEKLFRRPRLVVADQAIEPPAALRTGELGRVRWRQIDERGEGLVGHTDVATARRVVVLAKPDAPFPDAHSAATVLDVREANARAWVVVEVLDPNNIPAARVAGGARTVVVSSERLLGTWTLAAVRRPEQVPVAWDLLATRCGSEVYTCFLDADGLDGPGTPWRPAATSFGALVASVLALPEEAHGRQAGAVVPLGVVYQRGESRSHDDGELVLAPARLEARPVRALVALGDRFAAVERVALKLHSGELVPRAPDDRDELAPLFELGPAGAQALPKRVLMCGFRPASAVVCAELLRAAPDTQIVLVMRHEESLRQAEQVFREHGLEQRGRALSLVNADWTSERTLVGLEPGIDHVGAYDLVLLLGSHLPEYDGRTAITCLKIADLACRTGERFGATNRVIAGIADRELGRRLEERFRLTARGSPSLQILPTEDLRAHFVFQSIAVPGWESILLELLGTGGKGLLRLPLAAAAPRAWRFDELARATAEYGVLLGIELGDGTRIYAPGASAGPWPSARMSAVWLLGDEDGR